MFLHFSYSAPVRVSDIIVVDSVPARDITDFFWGAVTRDETERADVAVRLVAEFALRGAKTAVLFVVRLFVVATRDCVGARSDLVRDGFAPSRTAALARPVQISKFVAKTRIFFISDESLANL